jgi:hypothetical protein
MFNDHLLSPVLPKYFVRESTNLPGQALKNMTVVDRSKWLYLYPDPWDPTRLSLVKKASESNVWYLFLYNIFSTENCLVGAMEAAIVCPSSSSKIF